MQRYFPIRYIRVIRGCFRTSPLSGRIETEQQNDQSEDDRDCAHGLFTCRKSLRQRWRVARPATDSRRRTRRKRSSPSFELLNLPSPYFLKRSKIDISQKVKLLSTWLDRRSVDLCDMELFSVNHPRPEICRDQTNQGTDHCESNSDARN